MRLVVLRAQVWNAPALTEAQLEAAPDTSTGVAMLIRGSPLPSWPLPSLPQHQRGPLVLRAQVVYPRVLTEAQLVAAPATWEGTWRSAMVPLSPSWPVKSEPQQKSRPVDLL